MEVRMKDGSGRRHYRFLAEDVDRHGNNRVYFRRLGQPKIRLLSVPGTAEFDAEYQLAFSGEVVTRVATKRGPIAPQSFRWLVDQYYASGAYRSLDVQTQDVRKRVLGPIVERIGAFPIAQMTARDVVKLRDEKIATPHAANKIVTVIRQVFAWACDDENRVALSNPAEKVRKLATSNPDGWRTWTDEQVEQYCAYWRVGTMERLAIDLLLYTGARRSDIIRLGPQNIRDDGKLVWTEFKGRGRTVKHHEFPILPPLQASIDAVPSANLLFLTKERTGEPFGAKHGHDFTAWFRKRVEKAGLKGVSAHGIRKHQAVTAAENGATDQELMAMFGWTQPSMTAIYTRKANRAKMEAKAAPLLARKRA